jgi:ABC-type multidrug transport system fused ATPase/permease subunit
MTQEAMETRQAKTAGRDVVASPSAIGQDEEEDRGLWQTYAPLLAGRSGSITAIAVASFAAGVAEAALLVLVANLALAIGSPAGNDGGVAATLGVGQLDLSVRVSFAAALLLAAVRAVFTLWSGWVAASVTAQLTAEIRSETFADFATASWGEQARRSEADIQDLLQRHVGRVTSAVGIIAQAIGIACTVVALLASAVIVDPVAAGLLVISGAGLFMIIRPLSGLAKRLSQVQLNAGREYQAQCLEAVSTSLEMRSFGVGDQVATRLMETSEREVQPIRKALFLKQVVTSTYQTATVLLLLAGLFAVYSVIDRPLASLGAIVIILVRSLNQGAALQGSYHGLVELAPFAHRLKHECAQLRASAPTSGSVPLSGSSILTLRGISYSYGGSAEALQDIDIEVMPGEAVGIMGPSGSGKSTLIQLLLRLRHPTTGDYLVDNIPAEEINDPSWFSQIAFVPQDSKLLNDTVAKNIAFYREASQDEIVNAAKLAHIHEEIERMPMGYETVLGARGGALSGGQRQRMSIARALLKRPSILVLDEPTSALDMRSEALVHETFTRLKGDVTIFVIAHRLSTLNSCDRIIVMQDGRIQAVGAREEIRRNSEFYRDALALSEIRTDEDIVP